MDLNVGNERALLGRMNIQELRARYAELFGETTRAHHRTWLVKRILWRFQALAEGDLSERARQRAAELACDADLRLTPPRFGKPGQPRLAATPPRPAQAANSFVAPPARDPRLPLPGSLLTRSYQGLSIEVKVL